MTYGLHLFSLIINVLFRVVLGAIENYKCSVVDHNKSLFLINIQSRIMPAGSTDSAPQNLSRTYVDECFLSSTYGLKDISERERGDYA